MTDELAAVLIAIVTTVGTIVVAYFGRSITKKVPRDKLRESQFTQNVALTHEDRSLMKDYNEELKDLHRTVRGVHRTVEDVHDTLRRKLEKE